jgi:flagellin
VAQAFDVSKTAITDKQNNVGTVTIGAGIATANDKMHLTLVANGVTTVLSTASLANQAYNTGTALADLLTADTDYKNSGYYITQNNGTLTIEREDGANFTVDASHVTSSGASVTGATLITMSTGTPSVDLNVSAPETITGLGLYTVAQPNEIALALGGISTAVGANDQIALALTANGTTTVVNTAAGALTDIDDVVAALRTAYGAGTEYKFSKNSQDQLVVKRLDGTTFDMTLKSQHATTGAATTGLTATTNTGVNVVAAVTPYRVESPSAPRSMYLDFSGPDTYTFKFSNLASGTPTKTSTITANYTGTAANLSSIAGDIQAQLNALAHPTAGKSFNFNVVVENGGLRIDEANGYSFGISDFTSVGSGTLLARAGANQLSAANKSVLTLDDTVTNSTGKTTTSVGTTPTSVIMAFDALTPGAASKDTYSFTISDGVTTAVVSNVIRDGSLANGAGDQVMLAAINSALIVSGLDDLVTAALATGPQAGSGVFQLTHALGRTLTIGDFSSTGSTAVRVEPTGVGVTGTPRFLDDNFSSASGGAVVRNVDVLTASNATNAIEVLDAALNDVSVERANLGAIQSRLDHTINNLTNISTNTSASRSRIMDADYGAESANLAKAQIIQQAATAMLAQANQSAQSVLSLLQ